MRIGKIIAVIALLLVVAVAPRGMAQEKGQVAEKGSGIGGSVALKVGGTFHTVFSELSPFIVLELEGGILLLDRHLEIDANIGWAKPPASGSGEDPRLESGFYSFDIKQDFLYFGPVLRYRFFDKEKLFNLYAAAGPRLFLLRTVVTGASAGQDFGENRQTETRFGGVVALGGELNVWLGAVVLEGGMGLGNLDGMITGDTASSSIDAFLGYRFMF